MTIQFTLTGESYRVDLSFKDFILDVINEPSVIIVNGDITTNGNKTVKIIVTTSDVKATRLIKRSSSISTDYGIQVSHTQVSVDAEPQQHEIDLTKRVVKLAQTLCNAANSREIPLASSSTPDRAQYILAASQLIASRLH
jgi:uncharacterized protein (UPF0210 family)